MLEGVKIVDLTTVVFGPYCTQILADLGAHVLKVEPPGGDGFRYSSKPAKTRGMSAGHVALNRGKQSIVLDLKKQSDLETMNRLVGGADVFIHNVRGKAIEKLGLGFEAVRLLNPEIVYIHCTGFGSGGPYSNLQAYDDVIQAASGTATLISRADGNPRPRYIPSLIADKVAGLHAAYAALGAIIHRLRTGEGQFVEVPMFECFTNFMLKEHLCGHSFDPPVGPACYPRQIDPERQPFPTADGYISIVPYTDDTWLRLFAALGAPGVLKQEHLSTPIGRLKNQSQLYKAVAAYTTRKSTAEWVSILNAASIPAMPVRDISDILNDPHLRDTGFFTRREHVSEGTCIEMRSPIRYSGWDSKLPPPAPTLGQHTEQVLAEADAGLPFGGGGS